MQGEVQSSAQTEPSTPLAETSQVASPPVMESAPVREALDEPRRRLFELRETLAQRFDRRAWHEYVRLRRSAVKAH